MMNKNDRMSAMKAAGIETGRFFSMDVPEGATIIIATPDGNKIEYDRYGNPVDDIVKKVFDLGYIREDPAFRRFVTAQTFKILESGMSMERYLMIHKGYYYQFDRTVKEFEEINNMPYGSEKRQKREMFFNADVAINLCEDYLEKLRAYVNNLPVMHCKGKPYKEIRGFGQVFLKDIEGKIFCDLEKLLDCIKNHNHSWMIFTSYFKSFVEKMVRFPSEGLFLNKYWLSSYKGAGAYYTLMNLIKWNGCYVYTHSTEYDYYGRRKTVRTAKLDTFNSINAVEEKAKGIISNHKNYYYNKNNEPCEWYLLYGMLKEVIEDNHFSLMEKLAEENR